MLGVAVHHLRVRSTNAPKYAIAGGKFRDLCAHLLDDAGHFHAHHEGQFLPTVIASAHAGFSEVDATGTDSHADRTRRQI